MNKKILLSMGLASVLLLSGCEDDSVAPEFRVTDFKDSIVYGLIEDHSSSKMTINEITVKANDPDSKSTSLREHSFALSDLDLNAGIFTLQAEDESANKNKSNILKLANKTKVFDNAISLQINKTGIAFMADALEEIIDTLNTQSMLEGEDKTKPFYTYPDTPITDFYASSDEYKYIVDKPTFTIEPVATTDGTMEMSISGKFPRIKVGVEVKPQSAFIPNLSIAPEASATMSGSVIFTKDADNNIVATTKNVALVLGKITGLSGWDAVDEIIGNQFKAELETFLEVALDGNISELLTETFSEVPFENNTIEINGKAITFSALPVALDSENGALALMMNAHTEAVTLDTDLKGALGSLYIDKTLSIADNSENYDISTVVSANMLNQLLLAAYQSGATALDGQVKGYDYETTSETPAYIEFSNNGDKIGQFIVPRIKVLLTNSNDVETNALATITVDLTDKTIGISEGKLTVNLEQAAIKIDILNINGADGFGTALVETAVNLLLPRLVPELTSSLNELPLPDLVGYSINLREVAATDNERSHLVLAGNMISVARTLTATAPDTTVVVKNAEEVQRSMAIRTVSTEDAKVSNTLTEVPDKDVVLSLGGKNPTDEPLQYRYNIDGGNWSVWSANETVTLKHLSIGVHTATVCARTYEMKVDPSCAKVSFYK